MCVLLMLHNLQRLFMKPGAVSPGGQSKGKHKAQDQERLGSYRHSSFDTAGTKSVGRYSW